MSGKTTPDFDAVIVGSGFSGIYLLHKLRDAGFEVLLIDAAAQPGGIWYWNRYPGARVDSQVPLYEFSLPELWQTWSWSERFPGWEELRAYFRHVCDTLDLWAHMRLGTRVKSARFAQEASLWRLQLDSGDTVTARFLLPALGFASKPYVPDIPGLDTFSGDWICDFLIWLRDNDIERFEANPDAEAGWTEMVAQVGAMTLFPEADSWYMGANIPGKKRQLINFPSVAGYAALCEEAAHNAYRGFATTKLTSKEPFAQ